MSKKAVNLLDVLYVLAKGRKLIIGNLIFMCLVATAISLVMDEEYLAWAQILPPKEQKEGFGFSRMLASLHIPSLRLGEKGSPADIFIAILKSRNVVEQIVEAFDLKEEYGTDSLEDAIQALQGKTKIEKTMQGLIKVSVLDKSRTQCAEITNRYIALLDSVNQRMARRDAQNQRAFLASMVEESRIRVEAAQERLQRFQEKHNAISITDQVRTAIQAAYKMQLDIWAKKLEMRSLGYSMAPNHPRIRKIRNEIELLGQQIEFMKIGKGDGSDGGLNEESLILPLKEIPSLALEYASIEKEVIVEGALSELLLQQFAEATIEASNNTSTVQVLDRAVPPERKARPKRTMIVAIGAALGLFFSLSILLVQFYYTEIKEEEGEDYKKWRRIGLELRGRRSDT